MRDFRDAKAMARTLRVALAAKGLKITISQSLELIAEAFGVAEWNTLAAAIRAQAPRPREKAPPLPQPVQIGPGVAGPRFSKALELTLHRALNYADQRRHEYATLEHLLLALMDDVDACAVMKGCDVDLDSLRENLAGYVDNELKELATDSGADPRPTGGFQRVVQRAVIHVQELGHATVTGGQVLVAIFAERESHAAWFLQQQDMTREDAVSFNAGLAAARSLDAIPRRHRPVVVEKVKRRSRARPGGKTVKKK
jgi:Glyoxalase superfamily protein/Clp amino terminal domain, pathogenicity island component